MHLVIDCINRILVLIRAFSSILGYWFKLVHLSIDSMKRILV